MNLKILGTRFFPTSYQSVVQRVVGWVYASECRYICAANVHMIMEANDSPEFQVVVNNADIVTPDGMPLVWMLRLKGYKDQQRVYGPTLMLQVLKMAAQENIPVGFYGGDVKTLELLVERMQTQFSGLNVSYSYSPPFRQLSFAEDKDVVKHIQEAGVRILFVGLGCPKQEFWMAEHRDQISSVMIGVGAAFDFHAGVVSQAPSWMQKLGLEWLYRLSREPKRLWKRYLYHNPRFIILALMDLLGIFDKGKREKNA